MWTTLKNIFQKDNLYTQALDEAYQMLDTDWEMYEASVQSLRHSDTGDIDLDIYAEDKKVNKGERNVRRKIVTHLVVSTGADVPSGLALTSVVIDIERIGDYTTNIHDLARAHPQRLVAGSLEKDLQLVEQGTREVFRNMITAFKNSDEELARKVMGEYKEELSANCEVIVTKIISGEATDLSSQDATCVALYARYLKRIASHSRNVISSVVNPFPRIGYKEKKQ